MKQDLLITISSSLEKSNLIEIRKNFSELLSSIKKSKTKSIDLENGFASVPKEFLLGEINQILETHTIERTKYYIKRLKKGLLVIKKK